jgi:hypothetical protein
LEKRKYAEAQNLKAVEMLAKKKNSAPLKITQISLLFEFEV